MKSIKVQLLVIMIATVSLHLQAYLPIPPQCSDVNFDSYSYKISYRFTAYNYDYNTVYMGPFEQGTNSLLKIDFSSQTYPSFLCEWYTSPSYLDTGDQ